MIRRVDNLGRVVIPKEIRHKLKIKEGNKGEGTALDIRLEGEDIILRRVDSGCYCCGKNSNSYDKNIQKAFDRNVCPACAEKFRNAISKIKLW